MGGATSLMGGGGVCNILGLLAGRNNQPQHLYGVPKFLVFFYRGARIIGRENQNQHAILLCMGFLNS